MVSGFYDMTTRWLACVGRLVSSALLAASGSPTLAGAQLDSGRHDVEAGSLALGALLQGSPEVCIDMLLAGTAVPTNSDDIATLAVCEVQAGQVASGLVHLGMAFARGAQNFTAMLRISPGLAAPHEYLQLLGLKLYSEAAFDLALEALATAFRMAIHLRPRTRLWLPARPRDGRPVVVIFAGLLDQGHQWGPGSLMQGIPGSEEAVILLSRELVKAGAWVEVYNHVPNTEVGFDAHNVLWLPWYMYDADAPCSMFVSWRSVEAALLPNAAEAVFIWLHDVFPRRELLTPGLVAYLSSREPRPGPQLESGGLGGARAPRLRNTGGIFVLSNFHMRTLPAHARDVARLTRNGLGGTSLGLDEDIRESERCNTCLVYASSPLRGLDIVLALWPRVRAAVPNATMQIFYGFPPYMLSEIQSNPAVRSAKEAIEQAMAQDGVEFKGMVGQEELVESIRTAGFYVYPTSYPETSCISLMRAQALGAVPITSGHIHSALPETSRWDMGPSPSLAWIDPASGLPRVGYLDIAHNASLQEEWLAALIRAMQLPQETLESYRERMTSWAKTHFGWQEVAQQWLQWAAPTAAGGYDSSVVGGRINSDATGTCVVPGSSSKSPMLTMSHGGPFFNKSLYIPWIGYGGQCYVQHAHAMIKLHKLAMETGIPVKFDILSGESLVPRARSMAASRFLASNFSHMLFVDVDIEFNAVDVLNMLLLDKPVIAGAYRMKADDYRWAFTGDFTQTSVVGLYRAAWLTTGFMLIARSALEQIVRAFPGRRFMNNIDGYGIKEAYDFFISGLIDDSGYYQSEDFGFSLLCNKSGVETYLWGNATLAHLGLKAYVGNLFEAVELAASKGPGGPKTMGVTAK